MSGWGRRQNRDRIQQELTPAKHMPNLKRYVIKIAHLKSLGKLLSCLEQTFRKIYSFLSRYKLECFVCKYVAGTYVSTINDCISHTASWMSNY